MKASAPSSCVARRLPSSDMPPTVVCPSGCNSDPPLSPPWRGGTVSTSRSPLDTSYRVRGGVRNPTPPPHLPVPSPMAAMSFTATGPEPAPQVSCKVHVTLLPTNPSAEPLDRANALPSDSTA